MKFACSRHICVGAFQQGLPFPPTVQKREREVNWKYVFSIIVCTDETNVISH